MRIEIKPFSDGFPKVTATGSIPAGSPAVESVDFPKFFVQYDLYEVSFKSLIKV